MTTSIWVLRNQSSYADERTMQIYHCVRFVKFSITYDKFLVSRSMVLDSYACSELYDVETL